MISNFTFAQPAEIFTIEVDFANRLAASETISATASVVKVYDENGTDKSATNIVSSPVVSGTKLQQKISWTGATPGTTWKASFRAATGVGTTDSVYEEDIHVEIKD